ncbi:MAG: hypothetical protein RL654_91 [Pseudomonadota bacterium]|jgi:hypothetical protein
MSYIFKSRVSGNLLLGDVEGDRLMRMVGLVPGRPGLFDHGQLPEAIRVMEQSVPLRPEPDIADPDGFASLLALLVTARNETVEVLWGVSTC